MPNVAVSCKSSGAGYSRFSTVTSIAAPSAAASAPAASAASQKPSAESSNAPSACPAEYATYAPSMKNDPCAKLTMRVTPKISVRPTAIRNSDDADARPFSSWTAREASDTR